MRRRPAACEPEGTILADHHPEPLDPQPSLSYRDAGGATINRTAFFAAATAGKLVKAKGTLSGGVVTWSELELQN